MGKTPESSAHASLESFEDVVVVTEQKRYRKAAYKAMGWSTEFAGDTLSATSKNVSWLSTRLLRGAGESFVELYRGIMKKPAPRTS